MKESPSTKDDNGRAKLYADIAHPINSTCREMIQQRVIRAFEEEKARSKLPGYVPSYEDFDGEMTAASAGRTASPGRDNADSRGGEAPRPAQDSTAQAAAATSLRRTRTRRARPQRPRARRPCDQRLRSGHI